MLVTISKQLSAPPPMTTSSSRNSNTAGAPLPLIPRRSASASRSHSHDNGATYASTSPRTNVSVRVVVEQPTPPLPSTAVFPTIPPVDDSDTSSSSVSDGRPTIAPRAKRVRGQRMAGMLSPAESTPTPALLSAKADQAKRRSVIIGSLSRRNGGRDDEASDNDTPRSSLAQPRFSAPSIPLHLGTQPRHLSESHIDPLSPKPRPSQIQLPPSVEMKLVRKKSGQPVKSSLKSSRPTIRGSLSVITHTGASKSEPSTPTLSKAVHFDAQLEHVKLFLAEQKPLAVSRDGSPTEDTSGTDTDFPSFIFGNSADKKEPDSVLAMELINMPTSLKGNLDVELEEMKLSPEIANIVGHVRVKNLAFQKWLAVRFTFDSWQTTSEVAAKYEESFNNGTFDRFAFTIRLHDILPRLEEKSLHLALRYTVNGREIWDNNGGQDYRARFTKTKVAKPAEKPEAGKTGGGRATMADLHSKLEKVILGRENNGGFLARHSRKSQELETPPTFKGSGSLAARYDFGTSLKTPWKPAASPPRHSRMSTHPITMPSSPSSIPWPHKAGSYTFADQRTARFPSSKPLGSAPASPRELEKGHVRQPVYAEPDQGNIPFPVTSPDTTTRPLPGYFDLNIAASTRAGTPRAVDAGTPPLHPRLYSYPPIDNGRAQPVGLGVARGLQPILRESSGESEASTPLFASPSASSRESSPSPTDVFGAVPEGGLTASPATNYRQFLDKFCFYTGSEYVEMPADILPRAHSASSIEEFLSQPGYHGHGLQAYETTPVRSPSTDSLASLPRSGSSTPTALHFLATPSRSPPIAG